MAFKIKMKQGFCGSGGKHRDKRASHRLGDFSFVWGEDVGNSKLKPLSAPIVFVFLLFACCLLGVCGPLPAWADDALVLGMQADGDTHDEEQTLGWLVRRGDFWYSTNSGSEYSLENGKPLFCMVDDRAYDCRIQIFDEQGRPVDYNEEPLLVYYYDGDMVFQKGSYLDLEKVVNLGEEAYLSYKLRSETNFAHMVPPEESAQAREWMVLDTIRNELELDKVEAYTHGRKLKAVTITEGFGECDNVPYDSPFPLYLGYWDSAFEGCSELTSVKGFGHLNETTLFSIPYMFRNCAGLRELDLSDMRTRGCGSFQGMFDGCYSLTKLMLGDGWTQRNAPSDDRKARFPIDMERVDGDNVVKYSAGDIIPDGAATYVATGHDDIALAEVTLQPPDSELAFGTAQGEQLICEYNGRAIEPTIDVRFDGALLENGVDYTVQFSDNVEDGIAHVKIIGKGDYYGSCDASFEIVDTGAYAFFYENGLLVLKADHGRPDNRLVSRLATPTEQLRWFDAQTARPGEGVAWSSFASEIKRVIIDGSFVEFKPTSMAGWFEGCSNLVKIDGFENIDTSAAKSAAGMFKGCESLVSLDLNELNLSELSDLSDFFAGCSSLEYVGLADDALSGAVDASSFFRGCRSLASANIGKAWFSNLVDLSEFFEGCASLSSVDLQGVHALSAKSVVRMFAGCASMESANLRGLVVPSVESANGLFAGCSALKSADLRNADFSSAVSVGGAFAGCSALRDLRFDGLNLASATELSDFLGGCSSILELDFSGVVAPHVVHMDGFLRQCSSLTIVDLGDFDVSNVSDMSGLFSDCPNLSMLRVGAGWRNVASGGLPLAFPLGTYRVSPSYRGFAAGEVIPDGAAEYRFGDIAMQFCTVVMDVPAYACTGKLVEPKPEIMLGTTKLTEGVDYSLSYTNNLYPGKASMTVLGKGAFSGGLIVPFTIEARVTAVGDRLVYKTPDAIYTLQVTDVTKSGGRVIGMAVTIVDVKVTNNKVKTLSLPTQCTVGGTSATVTAVGSKLTGVFRNVKTVIIGPNVVIIGARAFAGASKVKKLIIQTARLKSAKNCLKGSKVKKVVAQVWLTKKQRKTYKKWFTKKSGKKGVKFIYG